KTSKEIINKKINPKKVGAPHDSSLNIPLRPKGSRTTVTAAQTTTAAPEELQQVQQPQKQGKIKFDHSDFLKEILVTDYSDYEDVLHKKKLDGDAQIPDITAPTPPPTVRQRVTTPRTKAPPRSDQLNKVHELENLLGLPHQGLMDETLTQPTTPIVWATP
ncbi:hypothetical protein PFISCL1PPCAC_18065, partial [Pristionchus fissidentatus]